MGERNSGHKKYSDISVVDLWALKPPSLSTSGIRSRYPSTTGVSPG